MATVTKDRTLKLRLSNSDDIRLRAAADALQLTVTEFVLRPALARADDVLGKPETILVDPSQFDAMLAASNEPVTPIDALVELATRPRRFVRA